MIFKYHINTDERGFFNADVRDATGKTVHEIDDDQMWQLMEFGFMSDKSDVDGLADMLRHMQVIGEDDRLVTAH